MKRKRKKQNTQKSYVCKIFGLIVAITVIAVSGGVLLKRTITESPEDTLMCIFRKNCASVPEERSAVPLQTEQSSAGLLVTIIYSAIPARKFKTICLGGHSA